MYATISETSSALPNQIIPIENSNVSFQFTLIGRTQFHFWASQPLGSLHGAVEVDPVGLVDGGDMEAVIARFGPRPAPFSA